MVHKMRQAVALALGAAFLLVFAVRPARAVDGTVVITQSLVNSSGGFPYKINTSGSYTLGSNLTVPANADGIDINVSDVTINLNGFSIIGPGGSPSLTCCIGINSKGNPLIHIYNGEVAGMSSDGISVGHSSIVEHMRVFGNGAAGIQCVDGCNISYDVVNNNHGAGILIATSAGNRARVAFNVVQFNGSGISVSTGSVIANNTVNHNNLSGIAAFDGVVTGNVVDFNNGPGLACSAGAPVNPGRVAFSDNVLVGDQFPTYDTSCIPEGHNLCPSSTCSPPLG